MFEDNNKRFKQILKECNHYSECISMSIADLENKDTLIFRRGMYWYRFENWNLPFSGLVRSWRAFDNDWIPKPEYTSNFREDNSSVVINIEKLSSISKNEKIRHVIISEKQDYISLVTEEEGKYNILILDKERLQTVSKLEDISLESSFFIGRNGILFCRLEVGRPSLLYFKDFYLETEELLFHEERLSYRLKIISTKDDTVCFVRSSNFERGDLYLYEITNGEIHKTILEIDSELALGAFNIFVFNHEVYFVYKRKQNNKQLLYFRSLNTNQIFELDISNEERVKKISIFKNNILLSYSSNHSFCYLLIRLKSLSPLLYELKEINFQEKTELYENNFSDNYLFFSTSDSFFESILSYRIDNSIVNLEFKRPIINKLSSEEYYHKIVWTTPDYRGIRVPISLFWKGHPNELFPKHKKTVVNVYGAYGKVESNRIEPIMYSIINAGFLYAIVHVRGGGFLGGDWYREGKGLKKWNSIKDFIYGVEYLIDVGIAKKSSMGLLSSSAGGIIAGAALNERKNLFSAILLFSPFINPLESLMNKKNPLSRTEIMEWGDVSVPKVRSYVSSYSPMQNVYKAEGSKSIIISVLGLNDLYIDNQEVIRWSEQLSSLGLTSYIFLNKNTGHGGLENENRDLLVSILNYFLEQIEKS